MSGERVPFYGIYGTAVCAVRMTIPAALGPSSASSVTSLHDTDFMNYFP
jgi:hypothetical protein